MGAISRIYSDESPAAGLSLADLSPPSTRIFFPDALSLSLPLSGTLRKIGYLYLCLAFPQTQSLSPFRPLFPLFAPLSLSLSPSAGLLARSALNPERLLCSINEGKSWKSKAETDKRRGGRARSWDVKEWDRKMDWMQGRVDGLSDDEQNFSPCSCSLSLFSSRLCVLFHRHAQIEPPLYSWIELNWKAKGKRTGEDKEQRKAVTGMPSRINKVGRSADLGCFFFPPESSHLGDFKARPVINKWAVGLLDLFKECLGSVTTSQDTLKEGGAHEVALGAFSVSI